MKTHTTAREKLLTLAKAELGDFGTHFDPAVVEAFFAAAEYIEELVK